MTVRLQNRSYTLSHREKRSNQKLQHALSKLKTETTPEVPPMKGPYAHRKGPKPFSAATDTGPGTVGGENFPAAECHRPLSPQGGGAGSQETLKHSWSPF